VKEYEQDRIKSATAFKLYHINGDQVRSSLKHSVTLIVSPCSSPKSLIDDENDIH
jgi:hypothetical protein